MRIATLIVVLAVCGGVRADEPAPPPPGALTLVTERVVVFKDSFGLFVKRGTGTADAEGRVFTEEMPDVAVLGTVWAVSEDERVLSLSSQWTERREVRTKETPCTSALELLRANVGREVTVGLVREGAADVTGTVNEVLEVPAEPTPVAPPAGPAGETVRPLEPTGGILVVFETPRGPLALPVAEVRTVTGPGLVTRTARREEVITRAKRLVLDLGREAAGRPATVRLLYLRPGIRWIPTYRLAGDLEAEGDLSLQGEVIDEAEDIEGAAVDLVVGVPHFRFRDVASPLVLESAIRGVLAHLDANSNLYGQQMLANRIANDFRGPGGGDLAEGEAALDLAPELAAAQGQDLFVYGVPRMSLRKGARATVPLWQARLPLRHVYTFDVHPVRDPSTGSRVTEVAGARETSPLRLFRNEVWHQLELANTTEVPWTTGAALLLRGSLPLGQDLLAYTSRGRKALLPVTVAVDVRGTYEEEEIDRQAGALSWNGHLYTRVRKRATATVVNTKRERADLRVSLAIGGKVESASDGGKVTLDDHHAADWAGSGWGPVNNHAEVLWELPVGPGETRTVGCEFAFYVR